MPEGKPKLVAIRDKAREQKNLNHYQVLGIASGPKATEAEIKKAYRRQSMKWHPDKYQMNADSKARANTTFKRLNEANQVLGEVPSKMMYDAELWRCDRGKRLRIKCDESRGTRTVKLKGGQGGRPTSSQQRMLLEKVMICPAMGVKHRGTVYQQSNQRWCPARVR